MDVDLNLKFDDASITEDIKSSINIESTSENITIEDNETLKLTEVVEEQWYFLNYKVP